MCGFSFTVFLSAFQLLPTAPFHIIDLGGSTFASGLFLGFLTYSSSLSAPLTGAFVDRAGQRRILITTSIALAAFSVAYTFISDYRIVLGLVLVHGVFWSGLLSASAAYMTVSCPRAAGPKGLDTGASPRYPRSRFAPTVGFWIYRTGGWLWLCLGAMALNLGMAAIAATLPEHRFAAERQHAPRRGLIEGRVLVLSITFSSTRLDTAGSRASPPCTRTSTA